MSRKHSIAESRSTSVDVGYNPIISWRIYNKLRRTHSDEAVDTTGCCYPQRLTAKDATYPVITKKLLAQRDITGRQIKSRRRLLPRKRVDPNKYITLHKVITVGKYSVYYLGTEVSSEQPKIVKIYRPTMHLWRTRRAGLEKQILSLPNKPGTLPVVHFAFRYQFYKCLVLEPMCNESLEAKLLYARRLMPDVVKSFMVDMVSALAFLHSNRIVHRNLTLDSFWIQANGRLKLTKFDYCIHKRDLARYNSLFKIKPTSFTAPELFSCKPYNRQTDIWALGVIFYRLTSGRFPFYGMDPKDLKMKIETSEEKYSEFFTSDSESLCAAMLEKDPVLRIGYKVKTDWAFYEHPYFVGTDWAKAFCIDIPGPQVKWKFPVTRDVSNKPRGTSDTLSLNDMGSFDLSKMKKRPFRMNAIRKGSHMFSPEYLEQHFPSKPMSQEEGRKMGRFSFRKERGSVWNPPSIPRTSIARRFSLRFKLLQAFKDLETRMESGEDDDVSAIDNYYQSISKNIDRYAQEKRSTSNLKPSKPRGILKEENSGSCV